MTIRGSNQENRVFFIGPLRKVILRKQYNCRNTRFLSDMRAYNKRRALDWRNHQDEGKARGQLNMLHLTLSQGEARTYYLSYYTNKINTLKKVFCLVTTGAQKAPVKSPRQADMK